VSRILVLAAIAAVIYWFVVSCRRRPPEAPDGSGAEDTVRCAHCGIYVPKREGVLANGRYFCSEAHHRAFIDMARRE
jgi:uncharacterized protein